MKLNQIHPGIIERGQMKFDCPSAYLQKVKSLEGQRFEIVLRKEIKGRSLNQNAYYWGVVIDILGNHLGYEAEEMHEALKFKFLRIHKVEGLETVRSTTDLSTAEFEEYLEKIRRWAAMELNCYTPLPNEIAA